MEEECGRCTQEVSCANLTNNYSNPSNIPRPRLKRVEAKEGRERGLAFRDPNISNAKV